MNGFTLRTFDRQDLPVPGNSVGWYPTLLRSLLNRAWKAVTSSATHLAAPLAVCI
jgi:hypothetical protein